MTANDAKKIVAGVIKEQFPRYSHLKLKASSTNFGCEATRTNYVVVEIQGWEPNPNADRIKQYVKEIAKDIMVQFSGDFINA